MGRKKEKNKRKGREKEGKEGKEGKEEKESKNENKVYTNSLRMKKSRRKQESAGPRLAFSHERMCWPCHVRRWSVWSRLELVLRLRSLPSWHQDGRSSSLTLLRLSIALNFWYINLWRISLLLVIVEERPCRRLVQYYWN